ncbi:MAG: hypothetical protein BHW64_03875 [Candidatus Melainabacteria bacterium LEY3_CP_29_8]|nr:MAG: hypothetical protein BHW64_03875 [Candidatus Melainabacteria bacterium LEY3_CP_29_8]
MIRKIFNLFIIMTLLLSHTNIKVKANEAKAPIATQHLSAYYVKNPNNFFEEVEDPQPGDETGN